jgi:DNA polymerase sigma
MLPPLLLSETLASTCAAAQVERVLHARVPVIKCVHAATGLSCDFSISRPECAFKAEMQK